jgi:hypothetical protein
MRLALLVIWLIIVWAKSNQALFQRVELYGEAEQGVNLLAQSLLFGLAKMGLAIWALAGNSLKFIAESSGQTIAKDRIIEKSPPTLALHEASFKFHFTALAGQTAFETLFVAIIIAFQLDHFAHFVKPGTQAHADAVNKRFFLLYLLI